MLGLGLKLTNANTIGAGGQWWRAPKHRLDSASPLAVLSPASGRSMLNGRAVNDNALISRQGGIKYVVGADGVLSATPANTLAYDWSSGTRELLFEGQATNLLPYSYGDTGAARCTKTLGQSGPDLGSAALRVTTTGEPDPIVARDVIQPPSGLTITFSVWLRVNNTGGNAPTARIFSYGSTGEGIEAVGTTDLVLSTQWRRYSHTRTFPAGMSSTAFTVRIDPFDGDGGVDTPLAGGSIDIDCWQVEVGPVATSYIPTSGAAVTRPADVAPLWSGAGTATAWAWRGVIPARAADWLPILMAGDWAIFSGDNSTPSAKIGLWGNTDQSGVIPDVAAIPGSIGFAGGWGAAGRRASSLGSEAVADTKLVNRDLANLYVAGASGLILGQVLRLRELVAWQLPDRPSASGCQAQARLWSA